MTAPVINYTPVSVNRPGWYADAACEGAGAAVMYPATERELPAALVFCRRCDVQIECLQHALEQGEVWGVWGGLTEYERDQIRRRRLRAAS
jgi:WhiB family transcriptional regulator, redox-sensing transcriptional regulator